jgi:1-acyl-sn-glycerol-3-phosphate acyltransferase
MTKSPTWMSETEPDPVPISAAGWMRVAWRGLLMGGYTFGGLAVLLLVRLVEKPAYGMARPWTPKITQSVCRFAFWVLGMRLEVIGTPMRGSAVAVANHTSWLDIFALNAFDDIYFVAKSEVANWPMIGWLARATGTQFITRDRKQAQLHLQLLQHRLRHGHRLLFFPEGTSTDGRRVLPFKPTLFQSFLTPNVPDDFSIQAITLAFNAPEGEDPRFYGWWGDSDLARHLLQSLAYKRHGSVQVIYHEPVAAIDFADRKSLARHLQAQVAAALPWADATS